MNSIVKICISEKTVNNVNNYKQKYQNTSIKLAELNPNNKYDGLIGGDVVNGIKS